MQHRSRELKEISEKEKKKTQLKTTRRPPQPKIKLMGLWKEYGKLIKNCAGQRGFGVSTNGLEIYREIVGDDALIDEGDATFG